MLLCEKEYQLRFKMLYDEKKIITLGYVIELAREQRNNLTETEQLMWSKLRNKQLHGFKFRCQHPLYRYILDFYCHKVMLAIEIDGAIHQYSRKYDNYRDAFIKSIGITTIRFSDNEVLNNIENVIDRIGVALVK